MEGCEKLLGPMAKIIVGIEKRRVQEKMVVRPKNKK